MLLHSLDLVGCSYQDFMRFLPPLICCNILWESQRVAPRTLCFALYILAVAARALNSSLPHSNSHSASSTLIRQSLFIELWGAKLVGHSVARVNLPPRCPRCLWLCPPKGHLALFRPDETTYDHSNKHSHSMVSLSVRLGAKFSYSGVWCDEKRVLV